MLAVIKIGASQYLVSPGQELLVNRLTTLDSPIVFKNVFLLIDGPAVKVGQPTVPMASVVAQVLGTEQGSKITVATYKAKSRHRRTVGFRPQFTRIQIKDITTSLLPAIGSRPRRKSVKPAS